MNELSADIKSVFSERLKELMGKADINQVELSRQIGVSESTVGKWILGKASPRMGTIQKLAAFFNVPNSYFLKSKDDLPLLNQRDEREIESDLEDMMNSMAVASYEGDDEEDIDVFKAAIRTAMVQAKRMAKKKYTPKKYRK